MSIALAILGLGILILVHEAGHMWMARAFGMRVDKFSIFFGPALFRWRGRHTTYQLASIPLGGYVQIAGMNPGEKLPEDDAGSYQNKSRIAQFSTVLAGPAVNYLFAIVLLALVMIVWGRPNWEPAVGEIQPGTPAEQGGLRPGDRILAIGQHRVKTTDEVLAAIVASGGAPVVFEIERAGAVQRLTIAPAATKDGYRVGFSFGVRFDEVGTGDALGAALLYPVSESAKILKNLGRLVTGKVSTKQVGGPVEIVRQLKRSFETSLGTALLFLAMLNVYLGLFNLLPLPALDGGRLVFLAVAMVTRRPINQRVENLIHLLGFVLLLGLLLLITSRDLIRIFS